MNLRDRFLPQNCSSQPQRRGVLCFFVSWAHLQSFGPGGGGSEVSVEISEATVEIPEVRVEISKVGVEISEVSVERRRRLSGPGWMRFTPCWAL